MLFRIFPHYSDKTRERNLFEKYLPLLTLINTENNHVSLWLYNDSLFYILFVFFNNRSFRQWLFAHCSTTGSLYFITYFNKSLDRTWFLYHWFLTNAYFSVFLFCNCYFTHGKLPLLFCHWNNQLILSCWPCFISKHTFRQPRVCI